jgi:haloacetate dehalogenase
MNGSTIVSRKATIENMKLHYLRAGNGPRPILLHGYTQASCMWRPIIPLLAEKFTGIAPNLPGSSTGGATKRDAWQ